MAGGFGEGTFGGGAFGFDGPTFGDGVFGGPKNWAGFPIRDPMPVVLTLTAGDLLELQLISTATLAVEVLGASSSVAVLEPTHRVEFGPSMTLNHEIYSEAI